MVGKHQRGDIRLQVVHQQRHVRQTAAENNHAGIDKIHHRRQRPRQLLAKAQHLLAGGMLALQRPGDNSLTAERLLGQQTIARAQPGAGNKGLDAVIFSAIAARGRPIVDLLISRQRDMPALRRNP